jgi:hypothetical protein
VYLARLQYGETVAITSSNFTIPSVRIRESPLPHSVVGGCFYPRNSVREGIVFSDRFGSQYRTIVGIAELYSCSDFQPIGAGLSIGHADTAGIHETSTIDHPVELHMRMTVGRGWSEVIQPYP